MGFKRYKAKHTRPDGYKSPTEAEVAKKLPKRRSRYESTKLSYTIPHYYTPDFDIKTGDGRMVHIEVKGYLRYEDQRKMRAVKRCNPDADIRFYFSKVGRVAGSKLTNVEWCKKYGFPVYIGDIPKDEFN